MTLGISDLVKSGASYDRALSLLRFGTISEDTFTFYCHIWQTTAPRFALQACHCEDCKRAPSYPVDREG